MAVYAIGDIQGCLSELEQLLDKLQYQGDTDQLWFVGDLINRGPQSLQALRYIKSLPNTVITLGNHDLSLLASAYCDRPLKNGDTIEPILKAPDRDELLHWLRQQKLFHRDKSLGYCMVHAGLVPQWSTRQARAYAKEVEAVIKDDDKLLPYLEAMYGNRPNYWDDALEGTDRLRFITNVLTRIRYCDAEGTLHMKCKSSPGQQPEHLLPWFAVPERRSLKRRIVFGHWSTLGLTQQHNVFSIDTGCVWQGQLTAMRLDTEQAQFTQVSSCGGISPL